MEFGKACESWPRSLNASDWRLAIFAHLRGAPPQQWKCIWILLPEALQWQRSIGRFPMNSSIYMNWALSYLRKKKPSWDPKLLQATLSPRLSSMKFPQNLYNKSPSHMSVDSLGQEVLAWGSLIAQETDEDSSYSKPYGGVQKWCIDSKMWGSHSASCSTNRPLPLAVMSFILLSLHSSYSRPNGPWRSLSLVEFAYD